MVLFGIAAILAFALDQFSKIWIRTHLAEGGTIQVLPGWLHLDYVVNIGAAWNVLSGQRWLLVIFTLIVIAAIVTSAREVTSRGKLASLGFGLILGGAVGNLTDRILFGHVTDFFDLDSPWHIVRTFPVFNVADSALTVGVVLMLVSLLFARPQQRAVSPESQL